MSTKGQQKSIPVFIKNHPSKLLALRFVTECSFYYTVITYSGKNQHGFGSLIIRFFFLSLNCRRSLDILDINPSSDILFANVFSHAVSGHFILCIVSLNVQKLLNFM